MKFAFSLTAACALILLAQIERPAAQINSEPVAREATNGPLKLSEQQKEAVIRAAVDAKSYQKTPKEFTPAVGATVPKEVYQHAFKPEIAREMPTLKHYWYAYLDREIVLIDAVQKQVVAVIPLPAKHMSGGQENQGAAQPAGEPKSKDGASTMGSVPAYTSPETTR
jgi:hypothetical protein